MAERGLVTPQTGPTQRIVPRPKFWASRRFQEGTTNTISFLIAASGLFILLFPLAWMISTSLKGQVEAMRMPPALLTNKTLSRKDATPSDKILESRVGDFNPPRVFRMVTFKIPLGRGSPLIQGGLKVSNKASEIESLLKVF